MDDVSIFCCLVTFLNRQVDVLFAWLFVSTRKAFKVNKKVLAQIVAREEATSVKSTDPTSSHAWHINRFKVTPLLGVVYCFVAHQ